MAFSVDPAPRSTNSSLSAIMRHKPELVEDLARCLDREMRKTKNWRHLARGLNVDADVIKRLQEYGDCSPTIRLFEYLEVTRPDLTILQLKNALVEIGRNDLFSLLVKEAGGRDSEMVAKVITATNVQGIGLLDKMALDLDTRSPLVVKNWFSLAIKLGIPRKTCWQFDGRLKQNPTYLLFQYLAITRPQVTLKPLKEALTIINRRDLAKLLQEQGLQDDAVIKDVLEPESELLKKMCDGLNREIVGVRNWRYLAHELEIPSDVYNDFGTPKGERVTSPTKEIMKWLVAKSPQLTLSDVVRKLDTIQRNDAIQIITKFFPDTVDSSMEPADSWHDLSSFALPAVEPEAGRGDVPYKPQDCGHVSGQGNMTPESQQGHCGTLPDRISNLIGRDEVSKQILTSLTSREVVQVVASPGYGKTSVVVEVAHRMISERYFIAYVNPRGVTCVEDLASKIIKALDSSLEPGNMPIEEAIRRLRSVQQEKTVLIIENLDDLLHLEDKFGSERRDSISGPENATFCSKSHGTYKKDEFLKFIREIGLSTSRIRLLLTSREEHNFVSFKMNIIQLEPLNKEDSCSLLKRSRNLNQAVIEELVKISGGNPLVICIMVSFFGYETPGQLSQRLASIPPCMLLRELSPENLADDRRIDWCLQVCFNRLDDEKQKCLVMLSTFPHRFTKEQFCAVFQTSLTCQNVQTCLNCLKRSTLLRFEPKSALYSLHPLVRALCSTQTTHQQVTAHYIRYYLDFLVTLCETFLSKDSSSAIQQYRLEQENIREALVWCGEENANLDSSLREHCTDAINRSAVFLAKVMKRRKFECLFCKIARQCRHDMKRYSECLTFIGMKIILSCTCSPYICCTALYRAKAFLSSANKIQSTLTTVDGSARAQCLSKLGMCYVREGRNDEGYYLLSEALKLREQCWKETKDDRERVMVAASHNDLAATLMFKNQHLAAIQTRKDLVCPAYESVLGKHPFLATTLNYIANSYYALGDNDNAIKFIRCALDIREPLLGHHQETARSLYDLGVAFSARLEYENALEHLKRAAALQEEVLDTYEEKMKTHQELSLVLKRLGREEEAEKEMERAAECVKKLEPLKVQLERMESHEGEGSFETVTTDPVPVPIVGK